MSINEMMSKLVITNNNDPFVNDNTLMKELFENNLDVYDEKDYYLELGIPNLYCKKYFDDEDFIYAKLKLSNAEDINLNVIEYITTMGIMIDFSENTLDTHKIYAKVLCLYQYANSYFTSLSSMRPVERIKHMPADMLSWIDNIVGTMKYILDNTLFNYSTENGNKNGNKNNNIEEEHFNELIYGLKLTVCHLKMILNHYRILNIHIYNMEDKHIKKMFKVLNNMCIIVIYLRDVL
jgi:hypothetical protein